MPADGCGETTLWDVVRPRSCRVPGVLMAGFTGRGPLPADGLRLIPHPAVTLAVVFGPGSLTVADTTGTRRRGSVVAGAGFGAVRLRQADGVGSVQVRLSPVTAYPALGAAGLDGTVLGADEVCGPDVARLAGRLADLPSWPERFACVEAFLARRYAAGPPVHREIAWAWDRLVRSHGRVRIDALAAELGWSRKRLWSRFHTQLGLPPKRAARLIRFDRATRGLLAGYEPATVAADCGYADQSHLHREVMAFAGTTPAAVPGEPFLAVDHLAWPGGRGPGEWCAGPS